MEDTPQQEIIRLLDKLAAGKIYPLRSARRAMVIWALDYAKGNVSQAAHILGTSRGTVYRYANSYHASA